MRGRTAGGRGRPQEPGASENLVRGLEAPFSGPEDWLPASDFCTGSSPPRRNDVSERPRPQPPRPPAPPHEPSPVTARGSARRSRAPGQRRVSCPNFHAAAASQRASTTFVSRVTTNLWSTLPPNPYSAVTWCVNRSAGNADCAPPETNGSRPSRSWAFLAEMPTSGSRCVAITPSISKRYRLTQPI